MSTHFVNLDTSERIIVEVRRHLFVFWARAGGVVILALVPLFAREILISFAQNVGLYLFFYLLWFLLFFVIFFYQWTDYYLDVWVITDKRIFDVEQRGVFNRTTSVFLLDRIQDVTVEVHGILATLFGFGDIHIRTAGDNQEIVIKNAARPLEVKRTIMEEHSKTLRNRPSSNP